MSENPDLLAEIQVKAAHINSTGMLDLTTLQEEIANFIVVNAIGMTSAELGQTVRKVVDAAMEGVDSCPIDDEAKEKRKKKYSKLYQVRQIIKWKEK
jgi:hypothetical protein